MNLAQYLEEMLDVRSGQEVADVVGAYARRGDDAAIEVASLVGVVIEGSYVDASDPPYMDRWVVIDGVPPSDDYPTWPVFVVSPRRNDDSKDAPDA